MKKTPIKLFVKCVEETGGLTEEMLYEVVKIIENKGFKNGIAVIVWNDKADLMGYDASYFEQVES